MKLNGVFYFLLLLTLGFILPSCSLSKRTAYPKHHDKSVQEIEEKLYGKEKQTKNDETLADKTVMNDTIVRAGEENIIMPDAVDVSNYEPEFKKKKDKEEPSKPIVAPENPKIAKSEKRLRRDMVEFGKKYLGVPYKYAGKKPTTGFDCSGLTCYIYQNFGMKIGAASRYQAQDGKKIPLKKTQAGDLILFGKAGKVNHVAMVVDNNNEGLFVIHSTSRGVVIDNILKSSYWRPKILFARKVVGE